VTTDARRRLLSGFVFLAVVGLSIYVLPHANNAWAVSAWFVLLVPTLLMAGDTVLGLDRLNRPVTTWLLMSSYAGFGVLLIIGWMRDWR
jgi:hypothetical protein